MEIDWGFPINCECEITLGLTQAMMFKKIMQHTANQISTFSTVNNLINNEIYLSWYRFTTNPKNTTLSLCKEVDWSWLQGV